jgi:hypothetical protein
MNSPPLAARRRVLAARIFDDRLTLSLALVFLIGAIFYVWTAATSLPLSLAGNLSDYYNQLAKALLHLHLAVALAPAGLTHLADPYSPSQNAPFQSAYHDLSLYHGRLYLDWGPAPVVVLLVPLHLLGLAASSSLTVALFSVVGLAFVLGTLRLVLKEIDDVPLWMGVLGGAVLVFSTTLPFLLRRPLVYEEAITGGFCFAMAGVYIAVRAIARRTASLALLALMSLCFGLAAGSRPPLIALGLLGVPVYLAVRNTRPHTALMAALAGPFVLCVLLLLAYNVARFGNPLEVGQSYNLAAYNPQHAHLAGVSHILPNLWFYGLSPPRPTILFPFLVLTPPPLTYPLTYPAGYTTPEITGGLLTMTPLILFALVLPWLWWRRSQNLGSFAAPLLVAAVAGVFALLFLSYEFFNSTERYETDFAGVFLLAALAGWFTLSTIARGWWGRAVRVCGAVLAVWGCLTGLAISFTGYNNWLQKEHPHTWSSLERAGVPISTGITMLLGHPILAGVQAPNLQQVSPVTLTTIGAGIKSFSLPAGAQADLTIVSPDRRSATVVAALGIGAGLRPGTALTVVIKDASKARQAFPVTGDGVRRFPIQLKQGLNRVTMTPFVTAAGPAHPAVRAQQLLIVSSVALASR